MEYTFLRYPSGFFTEFHPSTKVGPLGHAFGSLFGDLEVILYQPLLLENLIRVGGELLKKAIDTIVQSGLLGSFYEISLKYITVKPQLPKTGRLSCISDKNGKLRVIAIFDYWSQTALKGFHNYLYKLLRNIPEDCTFEQGDKAHILPKTGPYYCLDLTSATDRFPATLQRDIISQLIGKERAESWYQLMVDRDFSVPEKWNVPGNTVRFAVGQPLGAYSSWAVFALSHHILIRSIYNELGISCKGNYLVLGDDVVICNRSVARLYLRRLTELGVKTSPIKTLISRDTFEFAKRVWIRGIEVSPISTGGFISVKDRVHLLVPFLVALRKQGYRNDVTIPKLVGIIHSNLKTGRHSRLVKKALLFQTISNIINSKIGEVDGLNTIATAFNLPKFSCRGNPLIVANTLFTEAVHRLRNVPKKTVSFIKDIGEIAMDPPSHLMDGDAICNDNMVIPMSNVLENARHRLIPWLEFFEKQVRSGGYVDLSSLPLDNLIIPTIDSIVRENDHDSIRNGLTMMIANKVLRTWKQVYHRNTDLICLPLCPDESLMI